MKSNFMQRMKEKSDQTTQAALSEMIEILSAPDEQFDAVYEGAKERILQAYQSSEFQHKLLEEIEKYDGQFSVEEELNALDEIRNLFFSDEELSANKKDYLDTVYSCIKEAYAKLVSDKCIHVQIPVFADTDNPLPSYANPGDAGADVYSNEDAVIGAGETVIVKTGLYMAIPIGWEIEVRPRSGLSYKTKMRIANAPGTLDSPFRGEVGIIIDNIGTETVGIKKGDRIAQFVLKPVFKIDWKTVPSKEALGSTQRGEGGFGSTGQ